MINSRNVIAGIRATIVFVESTLSVKTMSETVTNLPYHLTPLMPNTPDVNAQFSEIQLTLSALCSIHISPAQWSKLQQLLTEWNQGIPLLPAITLKRQRAKCLRRRPAIQDIDFPLTPNGASTMTSVSSANKCAEVSENTFGNTKNGRRECSMFSPGLPKCRKVSTTQAAVPETELMETSVDKTTEMETMKTNDGSLSSLPICGVPSSDLEFSISFDKSSFSRRHRQQQQQPHRPLTCVSANYVVRVLTNHRSKMANNVYGMSDIMSPQIRLERPVFHTKRHKRNYYLKLNPDNWGRDPGSTRSSTRSPERLDRYSRKIFNEKWEHQKQKSRDHYRYLLSETYLTWILTHVDTIQKAIILFEPVDTEHDEQGNAEGGSSIRFFVNTVSQNTYRLGTDSWEPFIQFINTNSSLSQECLTSNNRRLILAFRILPASCTLSQPISVVQLSETEGPATDASEALQTGSSNGGGSGGWHEIHFGLEQFLNKETTSLGKNNQQLQQQRQQQQLQKQPCRIIYRNFRQCLAKSSVSILLLESARCVDREQLTNILYPWSGRGDDGSTPSGIDSVKPGVAFCFCDPNTGHYIRDKRMAVMLKTENVFSATWQ